MVQENTPDEQPSPETPPPATPPEAAAPVAAAESAAPPATTETTPAAQAAAAPAAPVSKKDMTPEQRAAAIKAAQERALRMKAERDAAKAAAEGGTAVVPAGEAAAVVVPPPGGVWRIPSAAAQQVALARPESRAVVEAERSTRQVQVLLKRRQVLRGGTFASLGGFVILMVGSFVNFFNPRHITGFGGIVTVPASQIPQPGADPVKIFAGKFYLVNLKAGEGGHASVPASEKGGLVALYQKCVHLGCTVPWRPEFEFEGERGWFRCPCHGSTYTKGGARVFGPAPRSLDTMDLAFAAGGVTVNTGKITLGDTNDPQRGKLPPA